MDLTGKVIAILQPRSGQSQRTGNPWMSQEYVIEVPGQFPRRMVFTVFGEERLKMFNIQAGEEITVQFDIDAHEYQGRWFNDIRAFNVFRGQPAQSVPAATTVASGVPGATPFPPAPDAASVAPQGPPFPPAPGVAPAAPQATPFPPAPEGAEEGAADDLPF
ncbi:MAG: DUF3127 domain-containing protein [Prevotella sp.]|nr:DUF3127 domain-containing protein [Prevotella sp.]MBR6190123.1 DUF3127 domain-containing protein [Prevotella sp.]